MNKKYVVWLIFFAIGITVLFPNESNWFFVMGGVAFFSAFKIIEKHSMRNKLPKRSSPNSASRPD